MEPETAKAIIQGQLDLNSWKQSFIIVHNSVKVDLSKAIGADAITPPNAPDQPSRFPKGCSYMFEKGKYVTAESMKDLLDSVCPETKWYKHASTKRSDGHEVIFKCKKYQVDPIVSDFSDGKWTKDNVNTELNKGRKSKVKNSAFSRMISSKLKYSSGIRKKAADRRGKEHKVDKVIGEEPTGHRTHTTKSTSKEHRCHASVRFFVSMSGNVYLKSVSNLEHINHVPVEQDSKPIESKDFTSEEEQYINLMFDSGVGNQTIANIMTKLLNKKGKTGEVLSRTIKSMNEQCQKAIDLAQGISSDMTQAEKTLARLNE